MTTFAHDGATLIRWLIRRDMPEILRIERESFEYPWDEADFVKCLRQKHAIGMVAEFSHQISGFMIYELHKFHLTLVNLAVDPSLRRKGVGAALIQKLINKISQQRRERIEFVVSESNLQAQKFFHAMGFRAVRVLRDYYLHQPGDAYLMTYDVRRAMDFEFRAGGRNRLAGYFSELRGKVRNE